MASVEARETVPWFARWAQVCGIGGSHGAPAMAIWFASMIFLRATHECLRTPVLWPEFACHLRCVCGLLPPERSPESVLLVLLQKLAGMRPSCRGTAEHVPLLPMRGVGSEHPPARGRAAEGRVHG